MAGDKIRSIKPSIRRDQALGRCSDSAKWLYVVMISMADDHGNFDAAPEVLAAEAFKWGPPRDVPALMRELAPLVTYYAVNGQHFGHLNGWQKHQRVDNANRPELPLPPGWRVVAEEKREGNRVRTRYRAIPPDAPAPPVEKWGGPTSHQVELGAAPLPTTQDLGPLEQGGEQGAGSREGSGDGAATPPPVQPLSPSPVRVAILPEEPERLRPRARRVLDRLTKSANLYPELDPSTLAGLARDLDAAAAAESSLDAEPISPLLEAAITHAQEHLDSHPLATDVGVALALKKRFLLKVSDKVKELRIDRSRSVARAAANGKAPPPALVDVELLAADAEASEARLAADLEKRRAEDEQKRAETKLLVESLKGKPLASLIGNGPRPFQRIASNANTPAPEVADAPADDDEDFFDQASGGEF